MQIDLTAMTPATRAVFDSLIALGQGNVIELVEKSGKARSTTDKAIKQLSDAGLIVVVDTDADAAEGVPTRWTLAEGVAEAISTDDADLADSDTAGDDEPGLGDDNDADQTSADDDPQPGTQPDDDTETDDTPQADADQPGSDADDSDEESDEDDEPDEDSDDDDTETDDDSDEDEDDEDEPAQGKARVTVVQPSRPGDRKVMAIKGVLAEFGDDGATLDEIVAESGIGHPTASRLLTAMEQADAARRLPGTPGRWIAGPTKASEVDPNPEPPRCPLCFQVVKGLSESPEAVALVQPLVRPDGTLHIVAEDGTVHTVALPKRMPTRTPSTATAGAVRRTDVTINGDGSQPFGRGDLERLTLAVLAAKPGRTMTPQEIASEISGQLGGRAVSSGAVRNNCTKAAAKGQIVMVSDAPLSFAYPAQAGGSEAGKSEPTGEVTDEVQPTSEITDEGQLTGEATATDEQS